MPIIFQINRYPIEDEICTGSTGLCFFIARLQFPLDNYSAMIQLMAGGGIALIGTTVVPLLSGLFG